MEGYLEIFGRKFCGKKGNFGLWRRKLFFGEWKHWWRGEEMWRSKEEKMEDIFYQTYLYWKVICFI